MTTHGISLIHITDLLHPYGDLDDHFDLAACFAFPEYELKGVILDISSVTEPHVEITAAGRTPGYVPVAQLCHITGRPVPVATSLQGRLKSPEDECRWAPLHEQQGVRLILDILAACSTPVVITLVGSCRDLAVAYNRDPKLVRTKVARIYVVAGDAGNKTEQIHYTGRPECNVALDRNAYIRLLGSGLPLFWCPCMDGGLDRDCPQFHNDREHGVWWKAHFDELLSRLRPEIRQYFYYAITQSKRQDFIAYLYEQLPEEESAKILRGSWHLFSTAAIAHGAGYNAFKDDSGGYRFANEAHAVAQEALIEFMPVNVAVDSEGLTEWNGAKESNIRLFHVNDVKLYGHAMNSAFSKVLAGL